MRSVACRAFSASLLAVALMAAGCGSNQGTGLLVLSISADTNNPPPPASKVVLTLPGGISRTYTGSFPPASGSLVLEFPNLPASDSPVTVTVQTLDSAGCVVGSAMKSVTIKAGVKTTGDMLLAKSAGICGDGGILAGSNDGGEAGSSGEAGPADGAGTAVDSADSLATLDVATVDSPKDLPSSTPTEVGSGSDTPVAPPDALPTDARDASALLEVATDSPIAIGGASGSGGAGGGSATNSGGVVGSGGTGAGGATGAGGSSSGGATGGSTASGGVPRTGGIAATGGVVGAGGTTATGGTSGTGGTAASGGMTGAGGGTAAQGQSCTIGSDCAGGLPCAGGVCCNSACTGDCESCVTGTCTKQRSTTVCRAAGANSTCDPAEYCTGTTSTCPANQYAAQGTSCGAAAQCAAGTQTTATVCNGTGTCIPGASSGCGNYVCDTTTQACKVFCSSSSDCISEKTCNSGNVCSDPPVTYGTWTTSQGIFGGSAVVYSANTAAPSGSCVVGTFYYQLLQNTPNGVEYEIHRNTANDGSCPLGQSWYVAGPGGWNSTTTQPMRQCNTSSPVWTANFVIGGLCLPSTSDPFWYAKRSSVYVLPCDTTATSVLQEWYCQ
jgi:hypothetical protein